jgi:DNA topoisomerase I
MDDNLLHLTHREFLKTDRDYEKAASAVNLFYVKDNEPGIARVKKGKGYSYILDSKPIKDKSNLQRIRKLVIPPSWTNVWICRQENGHIQATGLDLRKRKQYRYHAMWNVLRSETKFHRLYEFGKALPRLRQCLEKDLANRELTLEKVLATVISLMERTYIRIGNAGYEKMNGSYGLTTLHDKHVKIESDKISLSFKGKKGILHNITLRNKRLARTVKECRDIPGKELFQYYDADGNRKGIDSGNVNEYIRSATTADFSAKDIRTWAGSIQALQAFKSVGEALSDAACRKNIIEVLDTVSKKLGNTRTVCKKYYVHPSLLKLYEEKNLATYLGELDNATHAEGEPGLSAVEQVLMKILKNSI